MKKVIIIIGAITILVLSVSIAAIATMFLTSTNNPPKITYNNVPVYSYSITQIYPHDPSAFTQGFTFDSEGNLLEGTGINGASSLRQVNLVDGKILQQINLSYEYFGEGITVVDNKIVQLTWQNKIGFIYDRETLALLDNFNLNTEGWGLTYDGKYLIMSDGTDTLYFLDTTTYKTTNSINVYDGNGPVENLNELEYINGTIYANIWHSSKIAIINPTTGQVEAYIELEDLTQTYTTKDSEAVLNGIAYNTQTKQLYITGKNWSNIYEIEIKQT